MQPHSYFGPAVARFHDLHSTIATQKLTALANYLIVAAVNIPPASPSSAGALGFTAAVTDPHAAPTYADLQAESTTLRAIQAKRHGRPPHLKGHTTAELSTDIAGKAPRPNGRAQSN